MVLAGYPIEQIASQMHRAHKTNAVMTILVSRVSLDKRDAIRKEEILSAVVKSGRSYEEIMNFLNAGPDGEKTEK